MRPTLISSRLFLGALVGLLGVCTSVVSALADPPGRVGRLSYTEGTVSFHTSDQDQWVPATINYPVVAGNSFWTEPRSKAEIQVGSLEIRLDETTALDIVALDDRTTRLQLEQGVVNLHLRSMPASGLQVLTARGQVDVVEPGTYHIDAGHPSGGAAPDRLQVTVLEGKAEVSGPRSRLEILTGEAAVVSGDPTSFTLVEGNPTPFDDWALGRERREAAREATRYVSPEATGYQDLDNYGRWSTDPTYGAVWYPTAVEPGWAPYRYGHWAFVPPWGWTWIDDAPWGFAPFHYGRWVEVGGAWAWVPGVIVTRPVYAPALVAFVGGAGWGVSIAVGSAFPAVGWIPLAPFEVYHPYYPASVTYVRNVNITNVNQTVINNITNVTNVRNVTVTKYVNQQASTVVPAAAFTKAAPVQKAALAVPHEQLAQAPVTQTIAHLKPTAAAKAGVAIPAVAEAVVPRPNVPATVAKTPVTTAAPRTPGAAPAAEPAVPKAPGPPVKSNALRPAVPQTAHMPTAALAPAIKSPVAPPPPGAVTRKGAAVSAVPGGAPGPAISKQPAAFAPGPAVKAPATAAPRPSPGTATGREAVKTPATAKPPLRAPASAATNRQPAIAPAPAASAAQLNRGSPSPENRIRAAPLARQPAIVAPTARQPTAVTPPRPALVQQRPVQQTHVTPTPQGWTRVPVPAHPTAQPANKPPPHTAPTQPAKDDPKERKSN